MKPASQIASQPANPTPVASQCGRMRSYETNQEPSTVSGEAQSTVVVRRAEGAPAKDDGRPL
jgi:hypothetical protein